MEAELDKRIGCDFKRIPDVLKRLHMHKEELENKLTGENYVSLQSSEAAWFNALHKARAALEELRKLKQQCTSMSLPLSSSNTESDKLAELVTKFQPLVTEVSQLQHLIRYMRWMDDVQQLSSKLEVAIAAPSLHESTIKVYLKLVAMATKVQDSQCINLKNFVTDTKRYWKQKLEDKISSEFLGLLKVLKWPVTTTIDLSKSSWDTHQQKLTHLITMMVRMEEEEDTMKTTKMTLEGTVPNLHDPVVLVVRLLTEPLIKRFTYHFTGHKKTNCIEKPEWFLSQVLAWIRDHIPFLEERIQPLMEGVVFNGRMVDVRVEFIRCLLQEVDNKLQHDLHQVLSNETVMAHTIDELLSFERELRTLLGYYRPMPGCLGVILEPSNFQQWIALERKYTVERIDSIARAPLAWDLQYKEVVDVDASKVTVCAEQLMSLMASITDRYKLLESAPHQIDFVLLQLELLNEFHRDLTDESKRESDHQPLSKQLAAYLNTAIYVAMVAAEWGDQTFFLELQHCKEKLNTVVTSEGYPEAATTMVTMQEGGTTDLTGTIFDDVITSFSQLATSIEMCMASHILDTWKTKCAKYRTHKWQNLPAASDYITMELSSASCDPLVTLRQQLQFVENNVSVAACKKIWPIILAGLDSLMISEVVMMCHFNDGGGAQLQYDITSGLIPLLSQHCTSLRSSQIMMSQEACKLLTVQSEVAKSLKRKVAAVQKSDDVSYDVAMTSLAELNIFNITPFDAHQVLSRRLLPE
ncbi:RAD50-interacting protein 1-like isoform X2 [Dysidea avara]|uniref:RAD50-interacting protein 1-like isoform X2 n=1 Tax=Dysidea avara TaxID=196820 RepID=UPI003330C501